MTDDHGDETDANDPGIEAIARANRSIPVAPLDGVRFVRAARARRRRNRTIISSVLAAAVVVAGVSVATAGGSPNQNNRVDAADPPEAAPSDLGCSGMTVASADTNGDDLLLSLRNSGSSTCDVRGLEIASRGGMGDTATTTDLERGDSLAEGPLAPGNAVLITVATDTCQAAGLPVSVAFTDTSTLTFTFPGGQRVCNQPAFGFDITAMRAVPNEQEPDPQTQDLTVTARRPSPDDALMPPDSARWDRELRELTYHVRNPPGSCVPVSRATQSAGAVNLALQAADAICKAAPAVFLTISGLTEAPNELTVTADGETTTVPVTVAPEVVLLSASAPANRTRLAGISGPLNLQGDCVSVGTSVAVWPYGTTVISEAPLQIRVPGAGVFTEGDVVTGPGGFFDAATDDVLVRIPESCGTTRGTTINPQMN